MEKSIHARIGNPIWHGSTSRMAQNKFKQTRKDSEEAVALKTSLIQAVEQDESLWNLADQGYSKNSRNGTGWERILETLERLHGHEILLRHDLSDSHSVKHMWQRLRNSYKQQKWLYRERLKSGASSADSAPPNWPYYTLLRFIERSVVAVPTDNSMRFEIREDVESSGSSGDARTTGSLSLDTEDDVELPDPGEVLCSTQSPGASTSTEPHDASPAVQNATGSPSRPQAVSPGWTPRQQRRQLRQAKDDNRHKERMQAREKRHKEYMAALRNLQPDLKTKKHNKAFADYVAHQLDRMTEEENQSAHARIVAVINDILTMKE